MQPRLLFRTHYQVDEPAYMEFLVKFCSFPTTSSYPEVVASRLAQQITARGKEFNPAAGRYAVDLARGLGLLTGNNIWTEKGQLVALTAEVGSNSIEEEVSLTTSERLLHFRLFLEGDGGACLYLAHRLAKLGTIPDSSSDWNDIAREMVVAVYSDYLAITNNTVERVTIRRDVDRIKNHGYEGKTGSHKLFIHLQTLYRLGLVLRADTGASRIYESVPKLVSGPSALERFIAEIPDIPVLERVLKAQLWIEIAAKVFDIPTDPYVPPTEEDEASEHLLSMLAPFYIRLMSMNIPLCPIATLIEALQIELLATRSVALPFQLALEQLTIAQRTFPKDVRFHVDRRGKPAFLKLSQGILQRLSEQQVQE